MNVIFTPKAISSRCYNGFMLMRSSDLPARPLKHTMFFPLPGHGAWVFQGKSPPRSCPVGFPAGERLCTLIAFLFAVLLLCGCKKKQQDLLVVTLDTCRADHMGAYGHKEAHTPCFDELSTKSALFAECTSAVPITLPSHCTLFTGQYPWEHGVRDNGAFRLPDSARTLAETMRDAGYQTAAFVSSFTLDESFGLGQGFQVYDDRYPAEEKGFYPERRAEDTTEAALSWLSQIGKEPYFLWVHYFDPHAPYSPPPEFADRFPNAPYDAEISYMDSQMKRLLQALPRPNDTVILVVGDHGEDLGQHGEDTHGVFVYESSLRVPCLLSAPAADVRGTIVPNPISLTELMSCCLEALGLEKSSSRAFRLARGEEAPLKPLFFESVYGQLQYGWASLSGVKQGKLKYIKAPSQELYDLSIDPKERHNLFGTMDASELTKVLEEQRIEDGAWHDQTVTSETAEHLLQLGYLSSTTETSRPLSTGPDPKDRIHVASLANRALSLLAKGNTTEALHLLKTLSQDEPNNKRVAYLAARLNWEAQNVQEAEHHARKALSIDPRDGATWVLLGRILRGSDRLEEAAVAFGHAAHHPATCSGALNNQALCYQAMGRISDAINSFQRAIQCDPDPQVELFMNYGLLLAQLGRHSEAVTLMEKALAKAPNHPKILAEYGAVLGGLGEYRQAIEALEASLRLEPNRVEAWINLSRAWLEMKRTDKALEAIQRAAIACGEHPGIQEMKRIIEKTG